MTELKPCPFCGGEGEVRASNLYYDRVYLVRCRSCRAKTDYDCIIKCFRGQEDKP